MEVAAQPEEAPLSQTQNGSSTTDINWDTRKESGHTGSPPADKSPFGTFSSQLFHCKEAITLGFQGLDS